MAHSLLRVVRQKYAYSCGYCGVSEDDVGGELTVDHFLPLAYGGADSEENLVYACIRCNQYKGALFSDAAKSGLERRLLHPLRDDLSHHLREDETTGLLMGLTAPGCFQIEALRLNRPSLVINRQRRHLLGLLQTRLAQAAAENGALEDRLARQEMYIIYLEACLTNQI